MYPMTSHFVISYTTRWKSPSWWHLTCTTTKEKKIVMRRKLTSTSWTWLANTSNWNVKKRIVSRKNKASRISGTGIKHYQLPIQMVALQRPRECPRPRQKRLHLLPRKTQLLPFSPTRGTRYMRKVRRGRGKEKVRARARARRVIGQDHLAHLGPLQRRRKSHVDFTLDREQHALRDEIATTATQRIHQELTALLVEDVVYVIPIYKVSVRKGKTASMPMTKEH